MLDSIRSWLFVTAVSLFSTLLMPLLIDFSVSLTNFI
nr:MAG TPA: hypothetical protein [Caudoviricetes sp.]